MKLVIKIAGGILLAWAILVWLPGEMTFRRCVGDDPGELAVEDWCIYARADRKAWKGYSDKVIAEMKEQHARETACDHRSWFGLVGENECPRQK